MSARRSCWRQSAASAGAPPRERSWSRWRGTIRRQRPMSSGRSPTSNRFSPLSPPRPRRALRSSQRTGRVSIRRTAARSVDPHGYGGANHPAVSQSVDGVAADNRPDAEPASINSRSPPATSSPAGTSSRLRSTARARSARSAVAILAALAARMPFPVRPRGRQRRGVHGRVRAGVCRPRHRPVHPAAPEPQAQRPVERANRTHTEEFYEVTDAEPRSPTCAPRSSPGRHLQHRPTPPGPRLPHPGRVPGLARARGVTEVPNEYTPLCGPDRGHYSLRSAGGDPD